MNPTRTPRTARGAIQRMKDCRHSIHEIKECMRYLIVEYSEVMNEPLVKEQWVQLMRVLRKLEFIEKF